MENEEQEQNEEQNEKRKKCGDCRSYFKVHFNNVGTEDQLPCDEVQLACVATSPPTLLNRFVGLMGLKPDESPLVKSCTHFESRDEIVLGLNVLDWFCNHAKDDIKKQRYEPLLLELSNFLIEDEKFETIEEVSKWMLDKEDHLESEEKS